MPAILLSAFYTLTHQELFLTPTPPFFFVDSLFLRQSHSVAQAGLENSGNPHAPASDVLGLKT